MYMFMHVGAHVRVNAQVCMHKCVEDRGKYHRSSSVILQLNFQDRVCL